MPTEPHQLPQAWLWQVEWVDMRMHEAHMGQRRGRTSLVWMLVTAHVILSGSLSCLGARDAGGGTQE